MLIYQVNEDDKPKDGTIMYRDFSLRKRMPTMPPKHQSAVQKEKM